MARITKAEMQTTLHVLQATPSLNEVDQLQIHAAIAELAAHMRKAKSAQTRPLGERGQGRKPYAAEDLRTARSIALTDAQWAAFRPLGAKWLIEEMERADIDEERVRAPYVRNVGEAKRPRSIALTDAQWARFKQLGTGWLLERLAQAVVAA